MEAEPGEARATRGSDEAVAVLPAEADPPIRMLASFEDRSPLETTCPFLRSEAEGGLRAPIDAPDITNRCAALDQPQPPSARQQQLVCLTSGHVNCPRYLRGSLVARQAALALPRRRTLTGAILGAILVLIASTAASFAFVLARGGLELPVATTGAGDAAVGSAHAPVAPSPTTVAVLPSVQPGPSVEPTAEPTVSPEPSPSASLEPTPTPARTPRPTATPRPTSDRFAVLRACAGKPDCYIYTVREGDNLFSIAHWFGVSLDRIYALNPWTRTSPLRAGQELIIPTPTR